MQPVKAFSSLLLAIILGTISICAEPARAQSVRDRIRARLQNHKPAFARRAATADRSDATGGYIKVNLGSHSCAVWKPKGTTGATPLVVFSHGLNGTNTQSSFLMEALAGAGFLVVAPNHKDAMGSGHGLSKAQVSLREASKWTESTYADRRDDIQEIITTLHKDPEWNQQIDWSKLVLAGHSLGGYTALGLAGAWPSWKLADVKCVLALSPYSEPFAAHDTLKNLSVPVMYQTGSRDLGVYPFLKRPGGTFDQTPAPAYLVVLDKAGHFSFSNLNKDKSQEDLICKYSLQFLDKYARARNKAPIAKLNGVAVFRAKLQ